MSFSTQVKAELCRAPISRKCCAQAEAYGVLLYCSLSTPAEVRITTESPEFAARLPQLFQKAFQVRFDRLPAEGAGKRIFSITQPDKLSALWSVFGHDPAEALVHHINYAVLEEDHCRTAFLRGAFLAGGSVTDPAKRYHLELATSHLSVSRELHALLLEMGFSPKESRRKANAITYFKQSDAIEDFLTAMGAPLAAMELMNAKAEKDLRGSINRRVNCDAANLDKAVDAAQGQIEAIYKLEERGMLENLPDKLKEAVDLRMAHPELTLSQLAELCDPPVSKSAFNHRLRKLMELAKQ
ncbi:DNA-binding protein WhiA [uncultured Flavonifractor sp.]|uniref:Probable cell division protein WhiA n=1 Tax=Candidatus Flavonifractor intestinigallinarum TaxID=2838586 RepID=A0A9D2SAV4_9FIRM|nr:DNA-binding protein WhiA [uncultured Flavonifractor sp.]HJB80059.1 DNA-binding protein WhiA [Candidatus Flavonifractor intestinigallinarum]